MAKSKVRKKNGKKVDSNYRPKFMQKFQEQFPNEENEGMSLDQVSNQLRYGGLDETSDLDAIEFHEVEFEDDDELDISDNAAFKKFLNNSSKEELTDFRDNLLEAGDELTAAELAVLDKRIAELTKKIQKMK